MTAEFEKVRRAPTSLPTEDLPQVQRLGLTGYDFNCAVHVVLRVKHAIGKLGATGQEWDANKERETAERARAAAAKAREFLTELLQREDLTFGDRPRGDGAINIGFTYRGLEALELSECYLKELGVKAPAFRQGAPARAARLLGDSGESGAERWDRMFKWDNAHVLISIHAKSPDFAMKIAGELALLHGAQDGFDGWNSSDWLHAAHLSTDSRKRTVHFGFRDNIARPVIAGASSSGGKPCHSAGELLLGHLNDQDFNRWGDDRTDEKVAQFFRNGSFCVLRKIEQHEDRFDTFLLERAREFKVSVEYLKAKLCGRWPNGARVMPGQDSAPPEPTWEELQADSEFDFQDDKHGFGCPFGAHIRRTSPRGDMVLPPRRRPLFRRGMPYTLHYDKGDPTEQRGLIGLFFCASIEDQFEHVMSEWVEKMPMGPPSRGNAKDPLIGNNDDDKSTFHIPVSESQAISLDGFDPFVTTHGTLYALFPSRRALEEIAGIGPQSSQSGLTSNAARSALSMRPGEGKAQDASSPAASFNAPKDRFCDIVMEGGITSGIIYASAVGELAKHYRFRSIGGSSIGAFAAALTAAAEYRRRGGFTDGFAWLAGLPDLLAQEDAAGNTKLRSMFKPQKQTRRLFEVFLATLGYDTAPRRYLCGLAAALWQYRGLVFVAALVTVALVLGPLVLTALGLATPDIPSAALRWVAMGSWIVALLMALTLSTVLALLAGLVWDVWFGLVPNGFGLCRGWSEEEAARVQEQRANTKDQPSHPEGKRSDAKDTDLAGFLHFAIQRAAGRKVDDAPLTFKDLWEAPEPPTDMLGYTGRESVRRSINLELYATNLAHSRPYRFPLDAADDMGRLFFRMEDMYLYFPEPIWAFLTRYARPYSKQSPFDPPASDKTQGYFEVPHEHLPIAVAARLALSFPLLISAIPLQAIDYEKKGANRGLAECWMSDGGLCSNFPIHLFDSFLPKWPTFGISLQTRSEYWQGKAVWLPDRHYEGGGDSWYRIEGWPLKRLTRFLLSLWLATWRWNDMTMMRMPGVRDRVVRVLLKENEGGVNIKMTGKEIRALARTYGKPAGEEFVKKFVEGSDGWSEHRWVRFNRLLIALRLQIEGFRFAADLKRNMQPIDAHIDSSGAKEPLRGLKNPRARPRPSERPLRKEQIGELKHLLAALSNLEEMFKEAGDQEPYIAVPRPSLRVRHPT